MKSQGIHITLHCEHCGEQVPKVMAHDFPCPHCEKRCKANGMVAGVLLMMAKQMQKLTINELSAVLDDLSISKEQLQSLRSGFSRDGFTQEFGRALDRRMKAEKADQGRKT